jgi:hypothetical protein
MIFQNVIEIDYTSIHVMDPRFFLDRCLMSWFPQMDSKLETQQFEPVISKSMLTSVITGLICVRQNDRSNAWKKSYLISSTKMLVNSTTVKAAEHIFSESVILPKQH